MKSTVRVWGIGPFIIFLSLIAIYVLFFLELHLKWTLESVLFESLGSEVNIAKLDLKAFPPSLRLQKIEVTDPDKPTQNFIAIEEIYSELSSKALLKLSFHFPLTSVEGIQFHNSRKKKGKVLSKEKRVLVFRDPSEHKLRDFLAKENPDSVLTELNEIADGKSGKKVAKQFIDSFNVSKIQKELKFKIDKIESISKEIKTNLESDETKTLLKRIKNLDKNKNSISRAAETLLVAKEIKSKSKWYKSRIKSIEILSKEVKKEIKSFKGSVKSDLDKLGSKGDFSFLNSNKLVSSILGSYFTLQLDKISRIKHVLTQKIVSEVPFSSAANLGPSNRGKKNPTEATQGKKPSKIADPNQLSLEKKKTESFNKHGRWINFGHKPLPQLWLEKIIISSKSSDGQDFGDVNGEILNFSSSHAILGKPMTFNISGSVPKHDVGNFSIGGTIDETQPQEEKTDINVDVSDYVIKAVELAGSKKFTWLIKKAQAATQLKLIQSPEYMKVSINQILVSPDSVIESSSSSLSTYLTPLRDVPELKIGLEGQGPSPDELKIEVSSNLDRIFGEIIRSKLSSKINESLKGEKLKILSKFDDELSPIETRLNLISLDQKKLNTKLERELLSKAGIGNKNQNSLEEKLKSKLFKKLKL